MSEPKKLQVYGKFGGGLKTVNGLGPDENGNIQIKVNWKDLEDKPFIEEFGMGILFPERVITVGGCDSKYVAFDKTLVLGEIYTVTVDGVNYEIECVYNDTYGAQHQLIVNDDFKIYQDVGDSGLSFSNGLESPVSHTISITGLIISETLDPKYLPDISETVDTAVTAALTEAKESGEFDGAPGADGAKGDKGDQGEPGANGKDGTNGVSCTHSWNGTTLSVTSASGTSSANLKGEKGDKGDKGDTGEPGANGTNGKDGADGKTPVKGTDYYTEADKTEMVSRVLSALPTWTGGSY